VVTWWRSAVMSGNIPAGGSHLCGSVQASVWLQAPSGSHSFHRA
jgi:hypothetical protein